MLEAAAQSRALLVRCHTQIACVGTFSWVRAASLSRMVLYDASRRVNQLSCR